MCIARPKKGLPKCATGEMSAKETASSLAVDNDGAFEGFDMEVEVLRAHLEKPPLVLMVVHLSARLVLLNLCPPSRAKVKPRILKRSWRMWKKKMCA